MGAPVASVCRRAPASRHVTAQYDARSREAGGSGGEGLLKGKTIAVKDNVSVAGVPMTGGTHPYHLSKDQPYPISTFDAPVISRVLEAGGTIIGTSTCENYCMSALSFTSASGRSTASVSISIPPSSLHIARYAPAVRSRRMEK